MKMSNILYANLQEMKRRKRILVPYDGGMASEKALKRAIDFAKGMEKELMLLKVLPTVLEDVQLVRLRTPEREKITAEVAEEVKKIIEREEKLLARKIQSLEKSGVKAFATVVRGDPADEIIKMAHVSKPYMVVMGSRKLEGLNTLKKLGSVTRKVAENVDHGLFIIR